MQIDELERIIDFLAFADVSACTSVPASVPAAFAQNEMHYECRALVPPVVYDRASYLKAAVDEGQRYQQQNEGRLRVTKDDQDPRQPEGAREENVEHEGQRVVHSVLVR